ncbi:hypothetical protein GALMADRAFT_1030058 [Galerina marginata CBS 339.88]|uniref:Uncharacterized protein n=1 Tax=Galerina marginata (strain CBS 339.88) TaxID=685588 RepID=A0A067SM24_GALM3|nr:hypothetical protein GALMADRAFT_1030058 [Galerina marginata CBS 339.88]
MYPTALCLTQYQEAKCTPWTSIPVHDSSTINTIPLFSVSLSPPLPTPCHINITYYYDFLRHSTFRAQVRLTSRPETKRPHPLLISTHFSPRVLFCFPFATTYFEASMHTINQPINLPLSYLSTTPWKLLRHPTFPPLNSQCLMRMHCDHPPALSQHPFTVRLAIHNCLYNDIIWNVDLSNFATIDPDSRFKSTKARNEEIRGPSSVTY